MSTEDPQSDLLAAVMFAVIGAGALWIAIDYDVGTLRRLGPGALPVGVAVLLLLCSAGLAVQAVTRMRADPRYADMPYFRRPRMPSAPVVRAIVCVAGALVAFGLLIRPAGLFVATAVLVFMSSRGEPGTPMLGSAVLALVIPAICVGIFVYGVGLPIRVWP